MPHCSELRRALTSISSRSFDIIRVHAAVAIAPIPSVLLHGSRSERKTRLLDQMELELEELARDAWSALSLIATYR